MNKSKLKEAEKRFLMEYPGGFSNPLMLEIAKKHKVEKMNRMAQESFTIENFENPIHMADSISKIVSQSSLVSLFEKPKFRDAVKVMSANEKERLSMGLKEFIHGNQEFGFQLTTELLAEFKLAKWPLLTVCPFYYSPNEEVFLKPTTVKGVIEYFELKGLKYSPRPTYEFYKAYREEIHQMKKEVSASLQVDSGAFCGFLMMSMQML